ncbi:MAG: DNA-directed RNA polymerases I, II, and III subunit RPABC3 [Trizodia sp. TS-e1964]|nr:MAG: DNA-directed RNA polymerases I, II, and III subunit RPABC3 [Trizodia sp. TS-e1964]
MPTSDRAPIGSPMGVDQLLIQNATASIPEEPENMELDVEMDDSALQRKMAADAQLFNDTFIVTGIDHAKYDRCRRLFGSSTDHTIRFLLDVHTELFSIDIGDTLQMVIATTLNLDGTPDDEKGWKDSQQNEANLGDMFDYVMHGQVYIHQEGDAESMKVSASFGGLLMTLEGPLRKLITLRTESIYLLCKSRITIDPSF